MNAANDTHSQDSRQQQCKPAKLSPAILRSQRLALKLSQAELGRRAGVERPKICIFELGGAALKSEEQRRIRQALQLEADRLRTITSKFHLEQAAATGEAPAQA